MALKANSFAEDAEREDSPIAIERRSLSGSQGEMKKGENSL
jgi:hypothetical protein